MKEIGEAIKNGYIDKEGRPLKCSSCESIEFKYENWYEEGAIIEMKVLCKKCKKQVGYWSYGTWQF